VRFHADLSIPASQAVNPAGTLLFDPLASGAPMSSRRSASWTVTHITVSTDTAMRIVVGIADADGQRIRAGSFAANGGMASPVCVPGFGRILVFAPAVGVIDVSIDGYLEA
jgi:hypothetical protein